ncbi:2-succinyl-5-enolpyruvyl-6-hydroxy-3-cyclohexene-1-carboxylate synthase [Microbacterium sp. No. 7]|uniref:2-succinyl-5-enolpyruvyl-6-hydroxy-3- cyclohexene-1-carboxylate synthase n=1 Tax=Microbacterium sp. No. 7 TaxID=1714373 RepID=UPI0006D025D7|nr:thiamine pyrophosphate-binding protein [Microbacterium sp. No. 7]ALJ21462.1 2-succinyl-5-enolpyruvyl-6-hydroxy-3- cyclohexene-1-carboxylate synthase [Microbacterium sp. No. 7]
MTVSRAPATDAAVALLARLVARGVSHLVVSPGSRSQALALVAAELEARGAVRVHVRIDERVAGFTALGIARETGTPAAVICTSGTAVANLLPAVLEAHHSGVPLLLLTADRPPELRGVGANQTTRQPGLFAPFVRFDADLPVPDALDDGEGPQSTIVTDAADAAFDAASGTSGTAGPAHLNLPYREPLAGALPPWLAAAAGEGTVAVTGSTVAVTTGTVAGTTGTVAGTRGTVAGTKSTVAGRASTLAGTKSTFVGRTGTLAGSTGTLAGTTGTAERADGEGAPPVRLARGPRTIVVAGADAGPAAEQVAHDGGWPLVAEIVSGARFGRQVVHGYRELLDRPELGGRVERVVVLGHPTLSREVAALLARADVEVIALHGPGEPLDLNGRTRHARAVDIAPGAADREWLGAWMRASRAASVDLSPAAPDGRALASAVPAERLGAISAELEAVRAPVDREALVDAVWRATWPHDRLFFASSRLVRVADRVLGGKKVPVHSNRGLAGIDGTIATATGIALASQAAGAPGVTRVLAGDLAFLHDIGALLLAPGEHEPRMQVIVGNDGGGSIFDGLEVASVAGRAAMDRVLYTPHAARLADLAAAYGWDYRRETTRAGLDQALTSPVAGRQIIEVPLDR